MHDAIWFEEQAIKSELKYFERAQWPSLPFIQ